MQTYKRVLTIAGSDSGGGAGIQADIKTISALGCMATSVITAVTAQNTLGVTDIHPIPTSNVEAQLRAVLSDIGTDVVKIGMLHNAETIKTVYRVLQEFNIDNVILDPVMVSTSGKNLLQPNAISALQDLLIPSVKILTPNIPEAEILLKKEIDNFEVAAQEISEKYGNISVLLKAGHIEGDDITDIFYNAETKCSIELKGKRISSDNKHGTGCTLSSALAAFLAQGLTLNDATLKAKEYINEAILHGTNYSIGSGNGPVKHFYKYW